MANILFKKGSYNEFKSKVLTNNQATEGALYLTEDEGGLYLGLNGGTVKRIQGSVIFYEDDLKFVGDVIDNPPYSSDVIYFISASNALIRWNGTKWVQINATADSVTTSINNLQTALNNVSEQAGTNANNIQAINDLIGDSTKGLIKDIADAKKAGDDAQADVDALAQKVNNTTSGLAAAHTAAENAQTKANQAYSLAEEAKSIAESKTTMAEVEKKNYATQTQAQGYASAVQGDTDKTVKDALDAAGAASTAASNAQTKADSAYTLAGEAKTLAGQKTTMAEVEAKNYATKSEAQGYVNSVQGNTTSTVADAMTAAANAKTIGENAGVAAQGAQNTANDAKTKAENALSAIGDSTGGLVKDIDDVEKKADQAQKEVDALEEKVNHSTTGLAAAHTKAGEAQVKANAAYELADEANKLAQTKANATDVANTYATKTQAENWAKSYSATVQGETEKTVADLDDELTTVKTDLGNTNTLAQSANTTANAALPKSGGTMTGPLTLKADPTGNLQAATKQYVDKAKSDLTTTIGQVSERAEKGITDAAAAKTVADNNAVAINNRVKKDGDTLTGFLTLHADPTADKHAATKGYVDTQVQNAKDYAAGLVASNDAMTFKGVLNATTALPTAANTSKRGDTYKVGVSGTYAGIPAKVGDLFINTAADDAVPVWEHISSGYEDDYLQKLVNNNGVIGITNGVDYNANDTLGTVQIVGSTNSNIVVSTTSTNNAHTITVGMEWGSF